MPLLTAKTAVRNRTIGELGISYMGGVYNKFEEDGLVFHKKRKVHVWAVDFNTMLPAINTDRSMCRILIASNMAVNNRGGFIDLVQPFFKGNIFAFEKSVLNAALRVEYVD